MRALSKKKQVEEKKLHRLDTSTRRRKITDNDKSFMLSVPFRSARVNLIHDHALRIEGLIGSLDAV